MGWISAAYEDLVMEPGSRVDDVTWSDTTGPGAGFQAPDDEDPGAFWLRARQRLDGLPRGAGLNIAHEAVDRHAMGCARHRIALRWRGHDGRRLDITYRELAAQSGRFANVLRRLGVGRGDSVFTLLGRVPNLHVAVLGTLKAGAVASPLFKAYGPEPVRTRLALGAARVLVTTADLYRRKVEPVRGSLDALEHVLVVDAATDLPHGTRDLADLTQAADEHYVIAPTAPDQPALLHFTSGTSGAPKGALHVHEAVVAHEATARLALNLRPGDVFWCTADPGWVTGTSYGIIAPLAIGATLVVDEDEFDAGRWYRNLTDEGVQVWYTSPTAIRLLMRADADASPRREFANLRHMAAVGEPLDPVAIAWGRKTLGRPFHDTWWQTETGAIMIANLDPHVVKPGAMGWPIPGIDVAVVRRGADGAIETVAESDRGGELALRAAWPSMFRAYLGDEAGYRASFADGWYLSGDLVRRDADGALWFVGRKDEVIKSSGHLVGPIEVESALLEHPAVAEAAVVGEPDATALELVKAFIVLRRGWQPDESLGRELRAFARRRLGSVVAPREIEFRIDLPKTLNGKILRRLLRAEQSVVKTRKSPPENRS